MAKVVNLLSPTQRMKLLQIPDDFPEHEIVRYYALSPEDLEIIAEHRRPHNRLGFAVQLAYLLYPWRAWKPEEQIPPTILTYLARQIDESPEVLVGLLGPTTKFTTLMLVPIKSLVKNSLSIEKSCHGQDNLTSSPLLRHNESSLYYTFLIVFQ